MPRKTLIYATHDITLECDIYSSGDEPQSNPVVLFFHAGGLVGGARTCVPPWLVQACMKRQWPLLSASYRLLPQVDGSGLLQDARAAYCFAREWAGSPSRKVVVAGASAGFSVAALVAHHVEPPPIALLCITGIPTYQHPFFRSSTLIPPEPFRKEQLQKYLDEPVSVGVQPESDGMVFSPAMITSTGAKNPDYVRPKPPPTEAAGGDILTRGCLYDYFLYENMFPSLVGAVDLGFAWATQDSGNARLQKWPRTVFIQGDADTDVDMAVTLHAAECLGPEKARLCLAKGQPHLFEATSFIEDEGDAMDVVRMALHELDLIVADSPA